jgi:glycosyltransferase involved in cell wall biosynthesis
MNRMIRKFQPDLLHIHMPNTSAFWTLLSPAARRIPWIVHWHADIPLDSRHHGLRLAYRLYRPWEQALLRRASAIIATSPPYLESSAALKPWREKTQVIALGLPPSSDPSGHLLPVGEGRDLWPGSGLRLLAVGRLSYYKGFEILLHAIALVPEVSLVLVGDGERRASLSKLASELGIDIRVTFAGHVDDDTLVSLYLYADLFCLPSIERTEAFGLVLLEAMRARLPVVASDIPGSGVGYVVRNGETGLLVPPGDVAALAEALRNMAQDANLRQRMGLAGEQRWREEFTLDRAAEQTLTLYREVLQNPHCGKATPAS